MATEKEKIVIGKTEWVTITGKDDKTKIIGRIDTGATKSSIDTRLAAKLILGPVKRTKIVKSAHGSSVRPIVEASISIRDQDIIGEFSLADRTHMKYKVLIGLDILAHNFLIDPSIEAKKQK
ncbi:MAG: RimK/LysX family protein [archaeon]